MNSGTYLGNQTLADGNDVSLVQGLLGLLGNVNTRSSFLIDPHSQERVNKREGVFNLIHTFNTERVHRLTKQ